MNYQLEKDIGLIIYRIKLIKENLIFHKKNKKKEINKIGLFIEKKIKKKEINIIKYIVKKDMN